MEHYCVRRARVGREHPSLAVHLLLVRVIKNGVFVHSGQKNVPYFFSLVFVRERGGKQQIRSTDGIAIRTACTPVSRVGPALRHIRLPGRGRGPTRVPRTCSLRKLGFFARV